MKKIILVLMVIVLNINSLCLASVEPNTRTEYVKISKKEYKLMREQALLSASILQRVRDLEALYKQINLVVDQIKNALQMIKDVLKLDIDLFGSDSDYAYEDREGTLMDPGFIEVIAQTYDRQKTFDQLNTDTLSFDVYFNKNLFRIDSIEGDGVNGSKFDIVPLSVSNSSFKERVELPLATVLNFKTVFKIFFAPRNSEMISVGDKTNVDIRSYKNPIQIDNQQKVVAVNFIFEKDSPKEIIVKVK
jgi:hypothetical protein